MAAKRTDHVYADALRFLAAGLLNTILTAAVYFAGLPFLSPTAAYALAWLVGLCFVVVVYPERVFARGNRSPRTRLWFALLTVGVFLAGVAMLRTFDALLGEARVAFLLTLAVTTALNFLGGRLIARGALR